MLSRLRVQFEYNDLALFIGSKLAATDGYNVNERVEQKIEQYKQGGVELTQEGALEEIVADSMFKVFENERYVQELFDQHETLGEKIKSKLKNFVKELKQLAKNLKSPEARAMAKKKAATVDKMAELFNNAATVAMAKRYNEVMQEKMQNAPEGTQFQMKEEVERVGDLIAVHNMDSELLADVRFSMKDEEQYDYARTFAEQVEDFIEGKLPERDTLLMGRTPTIFQKIGLGDLPMTMDQTHLRKALDREDADHTFSAEEIKQLPQKLGSPLLIIESRTRNEDSIVAFVDMQANGRDVITPIRIETQGTQNGQRIDANHMVSFYGKKNATALLKHAVAEEEAGRIGIYYVDKKKGLEVVKRAGLQLPGKLNNDGLIHMITEKESPVNRNNKKNQIETAQFKRWFGKSKAVDEKGTPLVLYHQTNGTFNEFDTKRNGAGTNDMLTPHGIFMKTTAEQVKTIQGEKQMALYASIQNPLEMRNREEAQAFFAENVNGYAELLKQMQTEEEAYRGELEKAEAEDDAWYSDHYQEIRSGEVTEVQDSTKGILHRWEQESNRLSRKMKALLDAWFENSEHDGMHLKTDEGEGGTIETWIALDATQVKSATDNVGTFDGNNRNINYSLKEDTGVLASLQGVDKINENMRQQIEDSEDFRQVLRKKTKTIPKCRVAMSYWRQIRRMEHFCAQHCCAHLTHTKENDSAQSSLQHL